MTLSPALTTMEKSVDVVELISTLLDSEKYKEVLSIPEKEKLQETFKDNCWELISVVIQKIENDTIIIKPSLHRTCEELISIIIQQSQPEEALLEFIEQIELAKNDAQFIMILNPLQHVLQKLATKQARSLEWSLNSISTYIENITIPEYPLEGKQRLLLDSDDNIRRILKLYSEIPFFYEPFVKQISTDPTRQGDKKAIYVKEIITSFLISLLGKPFIYIDVDPVNNKSSPAVKCCTSILEDICSLEHNVLKFIPHLENLHRQENKCVKPQHKFEEDISPYNQKEKINMTTLSNLYYIVLSNQFKVPDMAIPQVYSIQYIFHTGVIAVLHLLKFAEFGPLTKGVSFFQSLLNILQGPVSHSRLSSIHFNVCKSLMSIAIFSSYDDIRKKSVKMIGDHINKFDFKGRVMLIEFLLGEANHSGMIGYAISIYKNSIDEAFKNEDLMPECFSGPKLMSMLKKICHLPYGAESDLVELADQIITVLNFLRYLAIKDKHNVTGIKECFTFIENDYLTVLRIALNMSKAHYEGKLKYIEEGKDLPKESLSVSISVGGNTLDEIPMENKKEILISALNAFHLIEGLMARLAECIHVSQKQL